jgi:DNA-binding response OmpR family regulator
MNVLIIEDEKELAHELQDFLSRSGYLCLVAPTGKIASELLSVNQYDFVLLDLGLPDYDGLDLLAEAHKAGNESVFIILTARGELDDRIKGLDLGADDYLAKPFAMAELHARMQAIIRRKFGVSQQLIPFSTFNMDLRDRKIHHEGNEITLTKKEFDLLHYMLLHKNRVLTRLQLNEHIWGHVLEDDYDSNYIDVHIKNIRKKLSVHGSTDWLETVRGVGYRANLS